MATSIVQQTPKIPHFIAEPNGKYTSSGAISETQLYNAAKTLLKKKFIKGTTLNDFYLAENYLTLLYAKHEHEVFVCLFLDNQHRLIKAVEMFTGSIDSASIYPREVVKKALALNAAAVIFAHNHPSGNAEPSQADKAMTAKLIKALDLVDVRVLDHFIVAGGDKPYSFALHGLISSK